MVIPDASSYRWVAALLVLPLRVSVGLNIFAPVPLFPIIMDHYDISRAMVSLMVVSVFLALTIFLVPSSTIIGKLGTRRALTVSGSLMSVGLIMGLMPNFQAQIILRSIFGIGAAITIPGSAAVLAQWMKPKERGPLAAIYLMGESTGVAFVFFAGVPLAEALGWHNVLVLSAAFALASTVAWAALAKQAPASTRESISIMETLGMLRDRRTLLLAFAGIGPIAMFISLSSWLPTYYNEVFAMDLKQATRLTTIMPLTGAVMNAVTAVLLARLTSRRPLFLLTGLAAPVLAFGTFIYFSMPLIVVSIILLSCVFWIFLPTLFTIPLELPDVRPENVALILSAALTLGNGATVVAPYLVGATTDVFGTYIPSFIVLAILPTTALAAAIFLPKTGPTTNKPQ